MSNTTDPDDDLLAVEAFRDLAKAADRLGTTLQATEQRQKTYAEAQTKAATEMLSSARAVLGASEIALEAAKARAGINLLWTGLGALGVVLVAFVGGFRFGQSSGWDQGHAVGYASAIASNADASWANTPNGQRALALDRLGSLGLVVACSQPGWRVSVQKGDRICFVDKAPDGKLYGWTIP